VVRCRVGHNVIEKVLRRIGFIVVGVHWIGIEQRAFG
jgi:hypothetical protein